MQIYTISLEKKIYWLKISIKCILIQQFFKIEHPICKSIRYYEKNHHCSYRFPDV